MQPSEIHILAYSYNRYYLKCTIKDLEKVKVFVSEDTLIFMNEDLFFLKAQTL